MAFLSWILIGLIMGSIARSIMPGKARGGWVVSLIVGVLGAMLGGWLGSELFNANTNSGFFSFVTWFWAFIGSLLVLGILGIITGRTAKN